MKNPRSFLIYNRGRRTKFHYGFNDLGARSRKNLKTPKHGDSSLPPSCRASSHSQCKCPEIPPYPYLLRYFV
eukprot:UN21555